MRNSPRARWAPLKSRTAPSPRRSWRFFAVNSQQLALNSVRYDHMRADSVLSTAIHNDAVVTTKIADNAVTSEEAWTEQRWS